VKRCDFCGEEKPLTIVSEPKHAFPGVICAPCVWRCVAKIVEHQQPSPQVPMRVEVIARPA
jgi:hypothetical protein